MPSLRLLIVLQGAKEYQEYLSMNMVESKINYFPLIYRLTSHFNKNSCAFDHPGTVINQSSSNVGADTGQTKKTVYAFQSSHVHGGMNE